MSTRSVSTMLPSAAMLQDAELDALDAGREHRERRLDRVLADHRRSTGMLWYTASSVK